MCNSRRAVCHTSASWHYQRTPICSVTILLLYKRTCLPKLVRHIVRILRFFFRSCINLSPTVLYSPHLRWLLLPLYVLANYSTANWSPKLECPQVHGDLSFTAPSGPSTEIKEDYFQDKEQKVTSSTVHLFGSDCVSWRFKCINVAKMTKIKQRS